MNNSNTEIFHTASSHRLVPALFTLTIFLSASLLFFVQPLFTKIVLPYIGGAPAVWTTAMLFFQTILICGYLYAHLSTKYLPVVAQIGMHLVLWAGALAFLPLSVAAGWSFDPDESITTQTLTLFAFGVGLPFAVLSANAPLIQSWYAKSNGPSADDPYFLYGASNLGSLSALLAFPFVAEPFFGAERIGWGWTAGFVLLGAFLALSGLAARKGKTHKPIETIAVATPKTKDYAWWLFLAFIPSSLMLAVTTKISTDLGSFPLIWILPLSLYLLTFVLTFINKPLIKSELQRWLMIIGIAIFGVFLIGIGFNVSAPVVAALMLAFFFIALNAHRILYESRPDKSNLTIFYVTMSVGGALGGLFNSIIAPILFADIEEARVTIVLASLLLCVGAARPTLNSAVKLMLFGTAVISPLLLGSLFPDFIGTRNLLITTALFFLIALILNNRNKIFVAVVTLLTVSCPAILTSSNLLFEDRSFFGAHKVRDEGDLRIYSNGTTIHGAQYIADLNADRPTPLSYYYPEGPIGQVMQSKHAKASTDIGVVGLGIGAMSCFARPGQSWQFYEIDLMVDQIARNPDLFTFMSSCAGTAPTHLGDARIVLEQQADTKYDILVIDAYSSDAVPMHLTTNEAIELYKNRLKPDGLIMMHISNRFYDISLPLGRSAADLGLESRIQVFDGTSNIAEVSSSTVVIFSQDNTTLAEFDDDERWKVLENDGKRVWTDDFANLLSILR